MRGTELGTDAVQSLTTSGTGVGRTRKRTAYHWYASTVFAVLMWSCLMVGMAYRQVPTALDDYNYLNHFAQNASYSTDGFTYIREVVSEPCWRLYTFVMSRLLSPADCIRFTIFVSLLLIAIAGFKSGRPLLFLLLYAVPPSLLTTVNYLQIRQGLALAVFLLTLSYKPKSVLKSSILPALIHSSFLLLIPLAAIRETSGRIRIVVVGFGLGLLALFASGDLTLSTVLGRRAFYLTETTDLNFKYWFVLGVLSILILYLGRIMRRSDALSSNVLILSSLNAFAALLLSLPLPAVAGRFFCNSTGMQVYGLSRIKYNRWQKWAILVVWGAFSFYSLLRYSDSDFFKTFVSLI